MRFTGWTLSQYDWCPYRKGKFRHSDRYHTGAEPCEDLQGKEHQSLPADHRKLGRGKEGGLAGFRGSMASWCLDFGLLAAVTVKNKSLFFSASRFVELCYSSPRKAPSALPLLTHSQMIKIIFWLNGKTSKHFPEQSTISRGMGTPMLSLPTPLLQVKAPGEE